MSLRHIRPIVVLALVAGSAACSSKTNSGSTAETSGGSSGSAAAGAAAVAGAASAGASAGSQGGASAGVAGMTSSAGATAADGGSPSAAGAAGGSAAGTGAGGGSSALGACPADATFCTGFESPGIPAGATYRPSYQTTGFAMFMKLSTTVTHSGTQALEVTGTDSYDWNMLSVPAPAATFWVRLYLRSSLDIGQAEHNSYYQAMTGDGEPNVGENVEVSEQYCQVVLNRKDDVVVSVGGMAQCGTGVAPLSKETWHCMETFFDGPNGVVQVYADNTKVIDKSAWTVESYKTFSFGYLGFHGPARTVWYDDIAVAPSRIGCP